MPNYQGMARSVRARRRMARGTALLAPGRRRQKLGEQELRPTEKSDQPVERRICRLPGTGHTIARLWWQVMEDGRRGSVPHNHRKTRYPARSPHPGTWCMRCIAAT